MKIRTKISIAPDFFNTKIWNTNLILVLKKSVISFLVVSWTGYEVELLCFIYTFGTVEPEPRECDLHLAVLFNIEQFNVGMVWYIHLRKMSCEGRLYCLCTDSLQISRATRYSSEITVRYLRSTLDRYLFR